MEKDGCADISKSENLIHMSRSRKRTVMYSISKSRGASKAQMRVMQLNNLK
jgi:hypothetical protein